MPAVVACVLLAFATYFVLRGIGLEPIVFADEWMHSVNTRLLRLSEAYSPSYLYYYLYRPTRSCGPAFLECARLMNIAVFAAAGLLFFRFARRYVTTGFAVALLILFLAAPSNIYVLLFSPDALFYSVFILFFVSLLALDGAARAAVAGMLLGFLALIKINAIFFLPGLLLFFLLEYWIGGRRFTDVVANGVIAVVALAITKMAFGYLLAGRAGLSITGQHYSGVASQGFDLANVIARLPLFAISVGGYLATVVLLLGTPIAALIATWRRLSVSERTLGSAALCILLPPLVVFGFFAALVADAGPYESIRRLGLRYFAFVFPFFYLVALAALAKLDATALTVRARIAAGILAIATFGALLVIANVYLPNLSESPELVFLNFSRWSAITGSALLLAPFLLMLVRPAFAARGFVAALVLFALVGNIVALRELRPLHVPSPHDAAGRYAALYLGPERADVAVVSTDLAGLYRAMFHLNAVGPIGVQIAGPREDVLRQVRSKKWALLIGPDALKFAPPDTAAPSGFALVPSTAVR
jgi:phosphoglycerol transferase